LETRYLPEQDLGISLQAFLGWVNDYAHILYKKQEGMLWESHQIEIGLGILVATNEQTQKVTEPSTSKLSN
jgi:transposase